MFIDRGRNRSEQMLSFHFTGRPLTLTQANTHTKYRLAQLVKSLQISTCRQPSVEMFANWLVSMKTMHLILHWNKQVKLVLLNEDVFHEHLRVQLLLALIVLLSVFLSSDKHSWTRQQSGKCCNLETQLFLTPVHVIFEAVEPPLKFIYQTLAVMCRISRVPSNNDDKRYTYFF